MRQDNVNDLRAFIAVARERSFTRAAARIGVSQSALSYTVRTLEARLGIRLLTRTTRSVSLTDAGDRLLQSIGPRFDEIDSAVSGLSALRDRPAGTIRITCGEDAADSILQPVLAKFLPKYPDIKVEIDINLTLTDIVAERYDAGIRLGEQVAKDMIAVRIGPEIRSAIVAAPGYFAGRPKPVRPQDLTQHNCINIRLPTYRNLYAWEFEKNGREIRVRVDGQLIVNAPGQMVAAALAGLGIAYLFEDIARPYIARKRLVRVLEDWCAPYPGYHLYYPSRRQISPAFALFVEALRGRA